jgi:hypothetical protein
MKKKTNTTGMLSIALEGLHTKKEIAEKAYQFGYMDCARSHRIVKAKTNAQLKILFQETLENKNNSFDSLYTFLEYLMSPQNAKIYAETAEDGKIDVVNHNTQILRRIFGGKINGYKVLDHIMDRAYKLL